jgi:hypothetical protein
MPTPLPKCRTSLPQGRRGQAWRYCRASWQRSLWQTHRQPCRLFWQLSSQLSSQLSWRHSWQRSSAACPVRSGSVFAAGRSSVVRDRDQIMLHLECISASNRMHGESRDDEGASASARRLAGSRRGLAPVTTPASRQIRRGAEFPDRRKKSCHWRVAGPMRRTVTAPASLLGVADCGIMHYQKAPVWAR